MSLVSLTLLINPLLIAGYTFGCHSLRHLVGGKKDCFSCGNPVRFKAWSFVSFLNRNHAVWAMASLVMVGFADIYVRLVAMGVVAGSPLLLSDAGAPASSSHDPFPRIDPMEIQTFEHDVLVIGAGGAGMRAAIEAADAGCSVGLVCKSLLGKAHTVMAEGGVAAALGNVDDRDGWKTHFADTMRGGQYVNNARMAELHAKEAPDRVRELEQWGAVFDRTKDGKILQRNFGGHRYPRLAHVGDRTGLEIIRTLQDHSVHKSQVAVYMECCITKLLKDGERVVGAVGYYREKGRFVLFKAKAVIIATGGLGKAFEITSNSWEYTGDGYSLAYHAGAELLDMEFIQFHPTGMVWPPSVRGILVTEGVRGEGGVLRNKDGKRFMFDDIPENYRNQTAKDIEEGWRYTQGDKNAMRPPELLTRDHVARCINREVKAGRGSPHGGVFLDISWIKERIPNSREYIKKKLPSMYHQFMELGGIDITTEAMEVGPTTHYTMGGIRVDGDTQNVERARAVRRRRGRRRPARRQPPGRQLAVRPAGVRQARRRVRREVRARQQKPGWIDEAEVSRRAMDWALHFMDAPKGDENPYKLQQDLQKSMQALVGIVRKEDEMLTALEKIKGHNERAPEGRGARQPRVQPRLAHLHGPDQPAHRLRGADALRDRAQGEPRRAVPRRLPREVEGVRRREHDHQEGRRRRDAAAARADPAAHRRAAGRDQGDRLMSSIGTAAATDRAPSRCGAASAGKASSSPSPPRSARAWWCSTPSTRSRRPRRPTWPAAGTARPASAARAPPRSTASRA